MAAEGPVAAVVVVSALYIALAACPARWWRRVFTGISDNALRSVRVILLACVALGLSALLLLQTLPVR